MLGRRRTAEPLRGGFGRSVVDHPQASTPGAGCSCRSPPVARDCASFRGRGFSCPERPPPQRSRGLTSSCQARWHRGPRLRRLRPGEPRHGEPDIGGRQLDPGLLHPSLRKSTRSGRVPTHPARLAAWRCREEPWPATSASPFFTRFSSGVCQATIVCIAGAGRRRYRGVRHPWGTRKRSKRGKRESTVFADLPIKLGSPVLADLVGKPEIRRLADSVASAGLPGKLGIGGFGRFGAKAGNRPVCRKIGHHRRVFRFSGNR